MTAAIPESGLSRLADRNFQAHQTDIHARTDRMFAWVMAIQYALAVVFALVASPSTWAGGRATIHPHVWTAVLLGGALAAYPMFLAARRPGETLTRMSLAVSQALFSALLIHLTGGRIETHFHVFGSLAFLAMYRDWRVLVVNSAVVALDHVVQGALFPLTIYGVGAGAEWRFLEHAGWVLFEDAFLLVACANNLREMRGLAIRRAELELAKEGLEQTAAQMGRQTAILRSVLEGMHDGVVVADLRGEYLHFNPAAEAIMGVEGRSAPCEDWSRLYGFQDEHGEPCAMGSLPLVRAMGGESVAEQELRCRNVRTGRVAWLEVSAEPVTSEDGSRIGGVAVFRDVTERRRILRETALAREEAERANRAKSEFLSRMSHELRTPMNAILGFGQLLGMDELTTDQRESTDQIIGAGNHLLRLINEVLDISGIESGGQKVLSEAVDVPDAIADAVSMLGPLASAAGVRLLAPRSLPAFVLADPQRVRQVLLNLVSNAIKYNVEGGEARIEIEAGEEALRIVVSNTGPGIAPEMEGRLFSPFDRLGAQSSGVEGTGLGLALSKRLTEAMGGSLRLRPCPSGACFVVELPVPRFEAEELRKAA